MKIAQNFLYLPSVNCFDKNIILCKCKTHLTSIYCDTVFLITLYIEKNHFIHCYSNTVEVVKRTWKAYGSNL